MVEELRGLEVLFNVLKTTKLAVVETLHATSGVKWIYGWQLTMDN